MRKDRYAFSIDIYDNEKKQPITVSGFNASSVKILIKELDKIIEILKQREKYD